MVLEYLQIQSKACASLFFSASPPRIRYLSLWMHQDLSPPWFGISATRNMKSTLAIKFPTPYEQWSNAPPPGRLSSSNSLPLGQEKTSNARDMPGGCLSFDLAGILSITRDLQRKKQSGQNRRVCARQIISFTYTYMNDPESKQIKIFAQKNVLILESLFYHYSINITILLRWDTRLGQKNII